MGRLSRLSLAALLTATAAASRAQAPVAPAASPTPKAPPPLRLAFTSLVAEATFELPGVTDFGAGEDAVWALNRATGALSRIDPKTNKVIATIAPGPGACAGLAAGFGAILVPQCAQKAIARVDEKTNTASDPIPASLLETARSFATGVGSIWVITDAKGTLARVDPVEKVVVALIDTPPGAVAATFGGDALWVASASGNMVTRVNPFNNLIVETIAVPNHPREITAGGGAVWTWNQGDGSVTRIDPKTNTIAATIRIGEPVGPEVSMAFGEGSLWIAGTALPLVRIDPRTNSVVQIFRGAGHAVLAVAHGSLWLVASGKTIWRLDPRRIEATRSPATRPAP